MPTEITIAVEMQKHKPAYYIRKDALHSRVKVGTLSTIVQTDSNASHTHCDLFGLYRESSYFMHMYYVLSYSLGPPPLIIYLISLKFYITVHLVANLIMINVPTLHRCNNIMGERARREKKLAIL